MAAATSNSAASGRPGRYTYLDLLRGLAALAVMLVHYRFLGDTRPGAPLASYAGLPGAAWLGPVYAYGGVAVEMFWLLSGVVFVIVYGGERRPVDVKRFAVWRFSRLYPLHLATLFAVLGIQWASLRLTGRDQVYAFNDAYHFVLNLLFVPAWGFERGPSFNAPIWSVSVELVSYAVFVAYLKAGRPGLGTLAALTIAFGVSARLVTSPILNCGLFFFYGACIAQMLPLWRRRPGLAVAGALAGLAIATAVSLSRYAEAYQIFGLYFFGLPAILLLALTLDCHAPPVPRRLHWVGDITYAVYLLHMPVLMLLGMAAAHASVPLAPRPETLVIYLATVIGLAVPTYRWFERPAQDAIRRGWLARRARGATSPA